MLIITILANSFEECLKLCEEKLNHLIKKLLSFFIEEVKEKKFLFIKYKNYKHYIIYNNKNKIYKSKLTYGLDSTMMFDQPALKKISFIFE